LEHSYKAFFSEIEGVDVDFEQRLPGLPIIDDFRLFLKKKFEERKRLSACFSHRVRILYAGAPYQTSIKKVAPHVLNML